MHPRDHRRAANLARLLFDLAPYGCGVIDRQGRWREVNAALCQMVGYSEPELLDRTVQDITHPDDARPEAAMLQRLGRDAPCLQMYKRFIHKLTGRSVPVVVTTRPLGGRESEREELLCVAQRLPGEVFAAPEHGAGTRLEVRPVWPISELLRAHWKWLLGACAAMVAALAPLVWTAGAYLVESHYERQRTRASVRALQLRLDELQSRRSR